MNWLNLKPPHPNPFPKGEGMVMRNMSYKLIEEFNQHIL